MPTQPAETEPVEFDLPVKTAATSLAVSVLATGFFTYVTFAGHGPFVVLAAAAGVFFAYGTVRSALRLIAGRPWAVVMPDGLTFAFSRTVTWDEVKSVGIVSGLSGAAWKGFIDIELHDPDAYLERAAWRQRRNAVIAMRNGHGPIRLPAEAFPVGMADVIATMLQFNPDLEVRD